MPNDFLKFRCPCCEQYASPKAENVNIPKDDGGNIQALCVYCTVCGAILSVNPKPPQHAPQTERK